MRILLVNLFLICSLTCRSQDSVYKQIDSVMRLANARGIFNGNILVAQKGKLLYQASFGYADGSHTNKLNPNLKFDIGSISKEFNGTGIMLLKERGLLSLDDPLSRFFPEFATWAQKVKIKHLLNYTSGLPLFSPTATDTDSMIRQNLLQLKTLAFEPGTAYIYNHTNVYLQMRVIEKVSGLSYAAFIKQNILKPVGMNATNIDYPVDSPGMARAFDSQNQNTPYGQPITGWLRLPITDLYKWTQCLHTFRIISKDSFTELAQNFPGGESSLGSTEFKQGELIWHQHQGSNSNYEALIYSHIPEAITIVMMTNQQQMKVHGLKAAILAVLHKESVVVPKKSFYLEIREKMLANVDDGLALYRELKTNHLDSYDFTAEIPDLINTGKFLQRRDHFDDAIKVFQVAVALPGKPSDLSYGFELIATCYQKKGDKAKAITYYTEALKIDPRNKNADGLLSELKTSR